MGQQLRLEDDMKPHGRAIALGFLIAALALTGAAGMTNGAYASDAPPITTDKDAVSAFVADVGQEFIDNQRTLGELKSWILAQPKVEASGYIDQVNDATNLATRLLWYGDDPLKAAALKQAEALGITATVEQRPQPLREINATAQKIAASAEQLASSGFTLATVVGVQADTSEIQVEGEFSDAARSADAANTVSKELQDIVGVPVSVVGGHHADPAVATRSNDTSPFYAGGYMISNGSTCSSGFALWVGGDTHTTTARHCNPSAGGYTARDGSANYGGVVATSSDGGLNVLLSHGGGRTFDNEWNNAIGFTKSVYNLYDVGLNDLICSSGGNSGVHCNVKVTAMSVYWNDGFGSFSNIRGVQQTSGAIAAIQGDSGGPVFMPYGGGDAQRVGAVGIIQAAENGSTSGCGSVHDSGGICSATILFSSIHTVILYGGLLNASLVTGG
ncbi:hypothetical protein ABCS02_11755 [Microbacterium sp. X-17]|uniref:hypothetical protein n=1 Tax=Microbacterium sp. X-17 TaxID=3144404 RepID=UPI0031F532F9